MYEQVTASIQKLGSFNPEQVSQILSRLKHRVVKKDECLIKEGQVCQSFFFINQGLFRHYIVKDDGEDAILNLFMPGEWAFEYKSFMSQQPSEGIIQAFVDGEVFVLSAWDFHELVKISDGFFKLGHIMELTVRNQDYQSNRLTPEQKYEQLLASKPEMVQYFPLKYIASYLGMTPETLSRIRRKLNS
ncbi:MAG: Crp/Fnr family transcriptional regulator [Bacteroidetes bacterium]|nr:Crp/Fnr family transcriptional regulator [Bacteroidota bacterium]